MLKLIEKKRTNPAWIKTGKGEKRFGLSEPEITPEEIANAQVKNPTMLSMVPSHLLLSELYQRSDEIQEKYDSHMEAPVRPPP